MTAIQQIQSALEQWRKHNFPNAETWEPIMGACEELGELCHAHLKNHEGVHTGESFERQARDAIGDTVIFLMQYCTMMKWDFETIVVDTWDNVKDRDWVTHPENGVDK